MYKSEHQLPMGTPLDKIRVEISDVKLLNDLRHCELDLKGITRTKTIELRENTLGGVPISISIN